MPDRGEFRAITDQMLEIIDELRGVEVGKRATTVGTQEFVDLAQEAVDRARLAFRWSQMQLEMAQHAAAQVARGERTPEIQLIDVKPRPLDRILALWREAQIRLEIAPPGSPAAASAADDIERLREEYQFAHRDLAKDSDLASF